MKVEVIAAPQKPKTYPYLARHKDYPNSLVLVGMHSIIHIMGAEGLSKGNSWNNSGGINEYKFEALKPGEIVRLEND